MDAPSQWETTLQCNVVSHWLGAFTTAPPDFRQANSQKCLYSYQHVSHQVISIVETITIRLLHSPRLVATGLSVGYETWPPIGWNNAFMIVWCKYRLGLPSAPLHYGLMWPVEIPTVLQTPVTVPFIQPEWQACRWGCARGLWKSVHHHADLLSDFLLCWFAEMSLNLSTCISSRCSWPQTWPWPGFPKPTLSVKICILAAKTCLICAFVTQQPFSIPCRNLGTCIFNHIVVSASVLAVLPQ